MALPRATGLPGSAVHAPGMPGASLGRPAVNKRHGLGQELWEAELFAAELVPGAQWCMCLECASVGEASLYTGAPAVNPTAWAAGTYLGSI